MQQSRCQDVRCEQFSASGPDPDRRGLVRVAVLGAGSWGTTLGSLLSERSDTTIWARDADVAEEVNRSHLNTPYLPDLALGPALRATTDIEQALNSAELVVLAVPAPHARAVLSLAKPLVPTATSVVSVSKGIELGTGSRMSELVIDVLDHDPMAVGVLSGPNLAREVLAGQPSATVIACLDDDRAERLRHVFTTESFRVFTSRDVVGCEIGGAVKNVIALAAGICDGLGFGWNTKAALMTRGLTEIARLGIALGANPMTFLGLAGNGDLTATCSSPQSRNHHVGEQLGKGRLIADIIGEMNMVAEGVATTPAIVELARLHGVKMPITRQVNAVLAGRLSAKKAVDQLMGLEPGIELDELA